MNKIWFLVVRAKWYVNVFVNIVESSKDTEVNVQISAALLHSLFSSDSCILLKAISQTINFSPEINLVHDFQNLDP